MKYEWTHEEIWTLTNAWPDDATPDEVGYEKDDMGSKPREWTVHGNWAFPYTIAGLFVASGIEWLTRDAASRFGSSPMVMFMSSLDDEEWSIDMGQSGPSPSGPTLLHAISEAVAWCVALRDE